MDTKIKKKMINEIKEDPQKFYKTYSLGGNSYSSNKKVFDKLIKSKTKDKPLFCRGKISFNLIDTNNKKYHYWIQIGSNILDYSNNNKLCCRREYYFANLCSRGLKNIEIYSNGTWI